MMKKLFRKAFLLTFLVCAATIFRQQNEPKGNGRAGDGDER